MEICWNNPLPRNTLVKPWLRCSKCHGGTEIAYHVRCVPKPSLYASFQQRTADGAENPERLASVERWVEDPTADQPASQYSDGGLSATPADSHDQADDKGKKRAASQSPSVLRRTGSDSPDFESILFISESPPAVASHAGEQETNVPSSLPSATTQQASVLGHLNLQQSAAPRESPISFNYANWRPATTHTSQPSNETAAPLQPDGQGDESGHFPQRQQARSTAPPGHRPTTGAEYLLHESAPKLDQPNVVLQTHSPIRPYIGEGLETFRDRVAGAQAWVDTYRIWHEAQIRP